MLARAGEAWPPRCRLLERSGPRPEDTAYGHFFEEQERFFERSPKPGARQLRRWLRFIETEGLECALWPRLFLARRQCLTWARLQSTSRQARGAHGPTAPPCSSASFGRRTRRPTRSRRPRKPSAATRRWCSPTSWTSASATSCSTSPSTSRYGRTLGRSGACSSASPWALLKGHSFSSEF